ncbi:MAG: PH domain-containing protein [Candidatus Aenigmatarchaeota archaeon]|nr:PH domain-containing protein [Candidatus Aenigmarchaeota archaeon]
MKEIKVKTSRKKFIHIYIFILIMIFLYPSSDFYNEGSVYNTIFFAIIIFSLLYAELSIANTSYIIKKDNITEIRGILTKQKTTIPISSISHINMKKNLIGMIINFGDIIVTSFTGVVIVLDSLSNPEKVHDILQENIEAMKNNHF